MRRRAILLAALIASATAVALAAPSAASAEGTDPWWATCAQHTAPVTVSDADTTPYHVVGRLCPADESDWLAAIRGAVRGRPARAVCGGASVELISPDNPDLQLWADDIAEGNATVDDRAGSPDRHRCTDCGHRWS